MTSLIKIKKIKNSKGSIDGSAPIHVLVTMKTLYVECESHCMVRTNLLMHD
jgi:hypothetical protein